MPWLHSPPPNSLKPMTQERSHSHHRRHLPELPMMNRRVNEPLAGPPQANSEHDSVRSLLPPNLHLMKHLQNDPRLQYDSPPEPLQETHHHLSSLSREERPRPVNPMKSQLLAHFPS